jgi:hypothetical protein
MCTTSVKLIKLFIEAQPNWPRSGQGRSSFTGANSGPWSCSSIGLLQSSRYQVKRSGNSWYFAFNTFIKFLF